MSDLEWHWLGRQAYGPMLEKQRHRRSSVIDQSEPEVVWLLEHQPTITTGRREVHGLPSKADLVESGIELFQTERGGLATYHGPGQLVVYPILNCWKRGIGAKVAVKTVEDAIIDWLVEVGITGTRRIGFPGIWVGNDKIAAIGMHFRQGVSMHGAAINLSNDLSGFHLITPCGITDGGITSVEEQVGHAPNPQEAAPEVAKHLLRNLHAPQCLSICDKDTP